MKVAVIGVGAMGNAMLGHLVRKGIGEISAYDVDRERAAAAAKLGAKVASSALAAAAEADLAILMVVNDRQVDEIVDELANSVGHPLLVAVAATIHPETMVQAGKRLASTRIRLIDAPVVYGLQGAIEGNMVSLCGGAADDVAAARPALLAYSRAVHHVGPLGAGMVAKTANNMLHWAASCAGFETLLLVKRYGLDAQRVREILLDCPARSGTLERWDTTHFTWPEKDMDIALEMAQSLGLSLPLFGMVDQLIKHLSADGVRDLLHGPSVNYLGRKVEPAVPPSGKARAAS